MRVVQLFISLLEGDSKKKIIVSNKKRFQGEYGSDPTERPPNLKRPEDYEAVFAGNIDDHFRIGNCPVKAETLRDQPCEVHISGGWKSRTGCSVVDHRLGLLTGLGFETSCLPGDRILPWLIGWTLSQGWGV